MTTDAALAELGPRLRAAGELVEIAGPLLRDETRARLEEVAGRARDRLAITGGRTVVALAGPTGVGKSSLTNAILGTDVADVGLTRPTTAEPLAVVVGQSSPRDLLRHVGVDRWHQLPAAGRSELDGLVLVDLPDHDSVVTAHRERAGQLVAVADRLLWVVDPEKYADASVHEDLLQPLRHHGAVLTVLLNRTDRLDDGQVGDIVADLRRLLRERDLALVDVLPVSAATGEGLDLLRHLLGSIVAENDAAAVRAQADLLDVAAEIDAQLPPRSARRRRTPRRDAVSEAALVAAGVPSVLHAAAGAHRHRARRTTGWPPLRRLQARGRDPLARLGLGRDRERGEVGTRSSRGVPHGVATATLARAVREEHVRATERWPTPWADALAERLDRATLDLPVALDRAVAGTDLDDDRRPAWWSLVGGIQVLLFAAMMVGAAWLVAAFVVAWLQLPSLPMPDAAGVVPWPTALLIGGAVAGLLVGALAAMAATVGARRLQRRLTDRLVTRVRAVVDDRVHDLVEAATDRAATARAALETIRTGDPET